MAVVPELQTEYGMNSIFQIPSQAFLDNHNFKSLKQKSIIVQTPLVAANINTDIFAKCIQTNAFRKLILGVEVELVDWDNAWDEANVITATFAFSTFRNNPFDPVIDRFTQECIIPNGIGSNIAGDSNLATFQTNINFLRFRKLHQTITYGAADLIKHYTHIHKFIHQANQFLNPSEELYLHLYCEQLDYTQVLVAKIVYLEGENLVGN